MIIQENLEKLNLLCQNALKDKALDEKYVQRLQAEIKEIDAQNEVDYFLGMHDKKVRYAENQNNLLVPYLLGIVSIFDINKESSFTYGEFPDIDSDFVPEVRTYLKQIWAPKFFGEDKVCNIGSYNTFGIKNSLINMARVFSKSRSEVLDLTTQLGLKDDDGNALTWDKALEIPAFKKYCDENADVADAARRLLNRNNSMGKHAGGLIVSSVRIDNFVPLVKDKEGNALSAWVEGLHGQDLGPMGLVKFDLLGLTNLMQIALACKLVKERHGLSYICALPGQSDWSDVAYLEDKDALAMANKGDLKCIFQFDSPGIRQMAKAGGVTSFNDLVNYTSLYRPSALGLKMHERYIARKRGKEIYELHPLLQSILGKTYGVMIFQESVMQILHVVGNIPLKDCEIVRKAISKKKIELFNKYKEMFLINGQKNLFCSEEEIKNLWEQIEAFSGYGFCMGHAVAYSYVSSRLLYLKSHYALEFYTAILSCETQAEKLKEYKLEAERHGIKVMPLDINKSGVKFQIVDEVIYFGLSNIKGIGEAVAQRIVDGQPYSNFTDFLTRFGTDASVLKPLIGLRVFKEADYVYLYKYYEWIKEARKRKEDRRRRLESRRDELIEEIKEKLPVSLYHLAVITPEALTTIQSMQSDVYADIRLLHEKYYRSADNYHKKVEMDNYVNKSEFNPDVIEVDDKLMKIYSSLEDSETTYYGFLWTHPLERSPDYVGGMTFESHRADAINHPVNPVECRVKQVDKMLAKNKKTVYYLLQLEDSCGEVQYCQVWEDDWPRFADDLQENALVRIRVKAPDGGFRRYTMESWPKHKKYLVPKRKEDDSRVFVMRRGPEDAKKIDTCQLPRS